MIHHVWPICATRIYWSIRALESNALCVRVYAYEIRAIPHENGRDREKEKERTKKTTL